jgi:hypothetical protein
MFLRLSNFLCQLFLWRIVFFLFLACKADLNPSLLYDPWEDARTILVAIKPSRDHGCAFATLPEELVYRILMDCVALKLHDLERVRDACLGKVSEMTKFKIASPLPEINVDDKQIICVQANPPLDMSNRRLTMDGRLFICLVLFSFCCCLLGPADCIFSNSFRRSSRDFLSIPRSAYLSYIRKARTWCLRNVQLSLHWNDIGHDRCVCVRTDLELIDFL